MGGEETKSRRRGGKEKERGRRKMGKFNLKSPERLREEKGVCERMRILVRVGLNDKL
ncbi:Rrt6p [Sesbania bispinosa]|nr:Rrt6p [Sesbania bispinosa]